MIEFWMWGLGGLVLVCIGLMMGPEGRALGLTLLGGLLSAGAVEHLPVDFRLPGLAVVALVVGGLGALWGLAQVPVAIPAVLSFPLLGALGQVTPAFNSLPMLGMIGLAAGALAWVLCKFGKLQDGVQGVAVGLVVAGAFAFSLHQGAQASLLACAGIGLAAGFAGAFATREEGSSTRTLLAASVWVAAGAVAFSTAREQGMAVTLATGLIVASLLGGSAAVHAAGGLLGLVAVQAFRLDQREARLALDFSHHHALLGLLLGALLVVGLSEIIESGPKRVAVALVGSLFVIVAGALIPVLTGPRAVTGLLIGAGLGPVIVALSQPKSQTGWVGAGALMLVGFGVVPRIMGSIDLTRTDKVQWLVGGVVLLALLGGVLYVFAKPAGPKPEESHA